MICETDQGLMLLKECVVSEPRIQFEGEILSCLKTAHGMYVDDYRKTSEGGLLSQDAIQNTYLLRLFCTFNPLTLLS